LSGSGHHNGSGVHGGSESRQTDLPFEEKRSDPGDVHLFCVPVLALRDRRPVRHRAESNFNFVPRGQTQNIHTRVQDSRRLQVSNADPGQVLGISVGRLRP